MDANLHANSDANQGSKQDYREKAIGCLLGADGMRNPAGRVALVEIARAWLHLVSWVDQQDEKIAGCTREIEQS